MVLAIFMIILAAVGVITLLAFMRARTRAGKLDGYEKTEMLTVAKGIGWVSFSVFFVSGLMAAFSLFTVIPANHAGVEVLLGKPTGRVFTEGFNLKNPLATVVELPGLQQESTYSNTVDEGEKGGPDAVRARTADNAEVDVDASVLWALDMTGGSPINTYRQYRNPEQVRAVLLRPVSRDVIRDCIAKVAFEEAGTSQREQIGDCARIQIAEAVGPYVTIRAVQIREVDLLSDQIRAGIEQKLAAEQAAQEAAFRRDQAQIDAETARIAAEGVANAEIERAKGIAEANRLVDESLTATLLQYRTVEFLSQSGSTVWVLGGVDSPEMVIDMNRVEPVDE